MSEMTHLDHLKIPLQVIKTCTQDFNQRNFIGKGGYGRVYKGILYWAHHQNQLVAVKRLDVAGYQGNKEFYTELKILSRYRHNNIIALIGFCDDNQEMILVYEYATHGSLDTYLRDSAVLDKFPWPLLFHICIGVVSALDYLHNHVATTHRIIHRDIKTANILLDENWNAKLSDFGFSKMGLANQHDSFVITNPAGTPGYVDPQYERTGILTKESDVYSFGVVLFEVLCGRPAVVFDYKDERRFLHHLARTCYKNGEMHKIIHHRIKEHMKPRALRKVSSIAYRCLLEAREDRPTIADVALQLKDATKIQTPNSQVTTMKPFRDIEQVPNHTPLLHPPEPAPVAVRKRLCTRVLSTITFVSFCSVLAFILIFVLNQHDSTDNSALPKIPSLQTSAADRLTWERTAFHFQPAKNFIYDPNVLGPTFHMGWFHLFYQYNPYTPIWGNMSRGHAVSKDMINWFELPVALVPTEWYDIEGVLLRSTTVLPNRNIFALYKGNANDFSHLQCKAVPVDTSDPLLFTPRVTSHQMASLYLFNSTIDGCFFNQLINIDVQRNQFCGFTMRK